MAHEIENMSSANQPEIVAGLQRVWKREKKAQSLTQSDVATALGMTQASFSQYLSGKTPISMKLIIRLCNVLRVPPQEIYQPIASFLPNRRHIAIKHSSHDKSIELDEVETINPALEYISLQVKHDMYFINDQGKEMLAPIGSNLYCLDIKEDGNWDRNKIIKATLYVIAEANEDAWRIVNEEKYRKLNDENKIEQAYIVLAIRLY